MTVTSYATFNALWGSGASDVHAAGTKGEVYSFSGGAKWAKGSSGIKDSFRAVWGSAKGDVHAVGDFGAMAHHGGKSWQARSSRVVTESLNRIWGSSATEIIAVGRKGAAVRHDGAKWHVMTTNTTYDLHGLHGLGPGLVHAVGGDKLVAGAQTSVALKYSGLFNSWSATTSFKGGLRAVWGSAKSDYWAVGSKGWIYHHDGSKWSGKTLPLLVTNDYFYTDMWGSSATDIYAVSNGASVVKYLHYDGSNWKHKPIGSAAKCGRMAGVWGTGPTNIFFVGSLTGCAARFDGSTWTPVATGLGGTGALYGVWGAGPKSIYMVGAKGTLLLSNGVTAKAQAPGTSRYLTHVWGSGPSNIYVVGEGGLIMRKGK